jgi:VID27 N-terminal region
VNHHFVFWYANKLNCARFTTAVATVRRTETPFEYQLVITRAYQEGEAELLDDIDEDEGTRFSSLIV